MSEALRVEKSGDESLHPSNNSELSEIRRRSGSTKTESVMPPIEKAGPDTLGRVSAACC